MPFDLCCPLCQVDSLRSSLNGLRQKEDSLQQAQLECTMLRAELEKREEPVAQGTKEVAKLKRVVERVCKELEASPCGE